MIDFAAFFEAYGKAIEPEHSDSKLLNSYAGVVPDLLIEFWERFGFGGFAQGLLWVINPTQLEDELTSWLHASKRNRAVPVVRTAFGNIVYWQKSSFTFLDVHYDKKFGAGGDVELLFEFYLVDEKSRRSVLQEPTFKKALKAHGRLTRDEMYAYKLPIAMGGDSTVKNMEKVRIREQLSILASVHGK